MRREAGFTLLEALVALTITALLLTVIYQVVIWVTTGREKAETGNASHHRARLLADRLTRELLSLQVAATADQGLVLETRGGEARLEYTSFASTPQAGVAGVAARIVYSLRPATEDEAGPYVLQRGEISALSPDSGRSRRFIAGVKSLAWRCLVDGSWQDRFVPSPDRPLPQAVELELEIADGTHFRSAFTVAGGG